jgi:hypothetical protein
VSCNNFGVRGHRQSESSVDSESIWHEVTAKLDNRDAVHTTAKSDPKNWAYAILAIAASLGLIWLAVRNDQEIEPGHERTHEHTSLAVDFQEVIEHTKTEPQVAIAELVAKYQGQELDQHATTKYLGYEAALFERVPPGFVRVSTHVLNMPCCKCSASICQREDGTFLMVFEHKDERPVWFGDYPSIETQCSGQTCKIIELAGQLAVSWKNGDRQLTLIGVNDIAEVNQWVTSMKL